MYSENQIHKIADILHAKGALLYMDGANMNALVGKVRPGDFGVDVMHLESAQDVLPLPHGGGGPRFRAQSHARRSSSRSCRRHVLVRREIEVNTPAPESWENIGDDRPAPMFRAPAIESLSAEGPRKQHVTLCWDYNRPKSVGRVRAFYGNTGMFIRALAYILANGPDGLRQTTEDAVLNANYIRAKLEDLYELPYKTPSMHEVVFSDKRQAVRGVKTGDIAKRLPAYGFHPYTVSFPLIVHGALMIEPTESESLQELDLFIAAMRSIAKEVEEQPELVKSAPHSTRVSRLDEVQAARKPILRWRK